MIGYHTETGYIRILLAEEEFGFNRKKLIYLKP
jgi:hypothetical protein